MSELCSGHYLYYCMLSCTSTTEYTKKFKGKERVINLSVFEKLNKKTHNLVQCHNCFVNCRLLELP